MNKVVIISVRPEHAINILNGKKTIELRKVVMKWVLEEVAKGNSVEALIYCTKSKPLIKVEYFTDELPAYTYKGSKLMEKYNDFANGKVVASFDINLITKHRSKYHEWLLDNDKSFLNVNSCTTKKEFLNYANGKDVYAIYIDNLNIFDTPKELSDFYKCDKKWSKHYKNWFNIGAHDELNKFRLKKAPQSMMTVWCE